MTALDDFIADLRENRISDRDQPVVCNIDTFIAALQEISSGSGGNSAQIVSNGRLTLTSGVPVLSSDVTAAATLFFTPYNGNQVLIWNGASAFVSTTFSELQLDVTALAADTVYDITISNPAAPQLNAVAWASAVARATALIRVNGVPTVGGETYLGTIATNSATRLNMMFIPLYAVGGTSNRLDVWNMYNRVDIFSINTDSTATWAYDANAYRAKNNNTNNATTFVCGLSEDALQSTNNAAMNVTATTTLGSIGIGLDVSNANHENCNQQTMNPPNGGNALCTADLQLMPPIGRHFLCPIEQGFAGVGDVNWQGNNSIAGVVFVRSNFQIRWRM